MANFKRGDGNALDDADKTLIYLARSQRLILESRVVPPSSNCNCLMMYKMLTVEVVKALSSTP